MRRQPLTIAAFASLGLLSLTGLVLAQDPVTPPATTIPSAPSPLFADRPEVVALRERIGELKSKEDGLAKLAGALEKSSAAAAAFAAAARNTADPASTSMNADPKVAKDLEDAVKAIPKPDQIADALVDPAKLDESPTNLLDPRTPEDDAAWEQLKREFKEEKTRRAVAKEKVESSAKGFNVALVDAQEALQAARRCANDAWDFLDKEQLDPDATLRDAAGHTEVAGRFLRLIGVSDMGFEISLDNVTGAVKSLNVGGQQLPDKAFPSLGQGLVGHRRRLSLTKPGGALKAIAKALQAAKTKLDGGVEANFADSRTDIEPLLKRGRSALGEADTFLLAVQNYPRSVVRQTLESNDAVSSARQGLAQSTVRARELLEGFNDSFVTETVSLFYFPDVRRFLHTLNPEVELVNPPTLAERDSAAALLAAQRVEFRDATKLFRETYGGLAQDLTQLAEKRSHLTAARSLSEKRRAELAKATAAAGTGSGANPAVTAATTASTAAQAEETRLNADIAALQKEVDGREKSLTTAATALTAARAALRQSEADELQSFADARDNRPYFAARASAAALDSVRRVNIYAYDDAKVLILRGPRQDVEQVKEIVGQLDAPTPQARITLWSLDLNVLSNRHGQRSLRNAVGQMDARLLRLRDQTGNAIRLFQKAVGEVVSEAEAIEKVHYQNPTVPAELMREFATRMTFFEPEVARRLGFDPLQARGAWRRYYFTRWTVPDPAGVTTLGETLMMFSLAKSEHRDAILTRFECLLQQDFVEWTKLQRRSKGRKEWIVEREFALQSNEQLKRRLKNLVSGPSSGALTSTQLEILNALKRSALEKLIVNAPTLCRIYDAFANREFSVYEKEDGQKRRPKIRFGSVSYTNKGDVPGGLLCLTDYGNQSPAAWSDGLVQPDGERFTVEEIELAYYLWPMFGWVKEEFGLTPETFRQAHLFALRKDAPSPSGQVSTTPDSKRRAEEDADDQRYAARCVQYLRRLFPRAQTNARIAAADQMLKELVVGFEDALDEAYVQPALRAIRNEITGKDLNVGQFQRVSLLASNRYVARVAPQASAQLDLSGETDILRDVQDLALLSAAKPADRLTAFSALKRPEVPAELYALNGRSSFVVTPIFDPSGQAIRFQLDYLKTLDVRAPDGTTNSELTHVESYPISIPVQLSNLELREITRFDMNAQLGVPQRQSGGVPILNQIPGIREIPLLGWFSRRDGRAATSQQTIILAQTATYPTIEDISRLLTGAFAIGLPKARNPKSKPPALQTSSVLPAGGRR